MNSLVVPKNVKGGGTFGLFENPICCKLSKKKLNEDTWRQKKFRKKSQSQNNKDENFLVKCEFSTHVLLLQISKKISLTFVPSGSRSYNFSVAIEATT